MEAEDDDTMFEMLPEEGGAKPARNPPSSGERHRPRTSTSLSSSGTGSDVPIGPFFAETQPEGETRRAPSSDTSGLQRPESIGSEYRVEGSFHSEGDVLRPCTRRMRTITAKPPGRNHIPGQAAASARVALPRGRRVVYVDHHHVHHHHHFHRPSEWGGPGCALHANEQRSAEKNAQVDVETAHNAAICRKAVSKQNRREEAAGSSRPTETPADWWAKAAETHPHLAESLDTVFTAEALVCRDPEWRAPGMIFSATSGPRAFRSGDRLPLNDYFTLISRLNPESRLKFSPFSVPASARSRHGLSTSVPAASQRSSRSYC